MSLERELKKLKLDFSDEVIKDLNNFSETFLEWNKIHNLGGARDLDSLIPHIIDSIYPLKFIGEFKTSLDIGTGAGFPGLILAICKRDSHFTLVEPRVKRVSFLNFVKSDLSLSNVEILRERVEDIETKEINLVTSKAVSDAQTLYKLSERFLSEDSRILLYKGKNTEKEAENLNAEIVRRDFASYLIIKK